MNQLIIIRTNSPEKLKSCLVRSHVKHQIIYDEPLNAEKSSKRDKLRRYIEKKSQENIFADYGRALKDKELEAEKELLEDDLD